MLVWMCLFESELEDVGIFLLLTLECWKISGLWHDLEIVIPSDLC
jgi:hypothetical protein